MIEMLFDRPWRSAYAVADFLDAHHYLGATTRGFAFLDIAGVIVFAKPTSRRLPQDGTWLELVRWCLFHEKNAGSQQWRSARRWLAQDYPSVTTVISYSDPSVGHTGALYKASGWSWAPTWHRLRPPPSGNGAWQDGKMMAVKDRWAYPLRADARRLELLAVNDASLVKRGHVGYRETFCEPRLRKSVGHHPANAGSTPAVRSKLLSAGVGA